MRRLLLGVLVAVPGCLAQGVVPARPGWIETLPEAGGRLYALGTAELGASESDAVSRASSRARLEVVARLRSTVRGETRVTTRTSELQQGSAKAAASGDRQVREELSVVAKAEDLPGLVVERTYSDPKARTVYALAYLDLAQARATLAARLDQAREIRVRTGEEMSRKARWRLRKLQEDLNRIDESIGLLAMTGTVLDLRPLVQTERAAVDKRLTQMEGVALPPMDLGKTAAALRSNIDLPPGIADYLEAQIGECGLLRRNLNPDLIIDLAFTGGSKGPEFIYVDIDIYEGVTYRMDAQMRILEAGGTALTRPVPLQVIQTGSPEGMVTQFRKQFERRLPRLIAEVQSELQ